MSFWDHVAVLLKYRRIFMLYLAIMLIASVSYAMLSQKYYMSKARLLPPPSDSFGLSSLLPSLAQGALSVAGTFSDEMNLVLSVLDSRELRDNVITEFGWMQKHKLDIKEDAYDRFDSLIGWEVNEAGLLIVNAEEETPELAAETVNYIVDFVRDRFTEISRAQARNQREFIERRLDQNYDDLAAAEDALKAYQEESGVFALEDQLRVSVEAISSVYRELAMAEVAYEVAAATLPSSSSQVIQAKQEVEALRRQYNRLENSQDSEARDIFISLDTAPTKGLEYLRRVREVEMQSQILEFLLPQFEQARIMEMREDSNIYILDHGQVPQKKSKPRRAFLVLAWLFASFLVLYPILLFNEYLERLKVEDPDRHHFIHDTLTLLKPSRFWSSAKPTRSGSSS